uniref:Uncharacterized protein n=1 Tax=Anguilla anguilla TaxID=7936 RepID=A0A0E9SFG1_ANGAN
MQFPPDSYPLQ